MIASIVVSRTFIFPAVKSDFFPRSGSRRSSGLDSWPCHRGSGSPFPPTERNGRPFKTDKVNNSDIFRGIGLGARASRATRISDGMFTIAART